MKKGEYEIYHTKKIMEKEQNEIEEKYTRGDKINDYVDRLVRMSLRRNSKLGYEETGKLTGDETLVEPDSILDTWPGLTIEDAEEIARRFNSLVEEAKIERAADQYAKGGLTPEEVQHAGNVLETPEISPNREEAEEQK